MSYLSRRPSGTRPTHAMVLAAGLGTRLRPVTATRPKPLVEVGGRALIDRALDRLADDGIATAVVNLHYLGDMIEAHLKHRPRPQIVFSREPVLLDTGGGIAAALPLLGAEPFIVVNSDVFWLNGPTSALSRLAAIWDDEAMDGLLLMHSTVEAFGYDGLGDFIVDPFGRLARRPEKEISPTLFTGVQILHPRLFKDAPAGVFSLNVLWDRAIEAGRLFGMVHDGEWFHVGPPQGLADANAYLSTAFPDSRRR